MNNESVKIIVKASNQQFNDEIINCKLSWSIKNLKDHLAEVYPCKPKADEQKLIYSGQLLTDAALLKDVLRYYEENIDSNHSHIIHLVYIPKVSAKEKKDDVKNENQLTQRKNMTNKQQEEIQTRQNVCNNTINNNGNNLFDYQQINNITAQQIAMQTWLQTLYLQYYNNYINGLQSSVSSSSEALNYQNFVSLYTSNPSVINSLNFGQTQNIQSNNINNNTTTTQSDIEPVNNIQPEPQQQPNNNNNNQPRFPNIIQEEEPENRDWLDMFYACTHMMIFLALVYVYSSPVRCAIVLFVATILYLYHNGFLRNNLTNVRRINEQQANNNNNNNEVNNNNNNQAGVHEPEQNNSNNNQNVNENSTSNNVENESRSILYVIRTFVVSFFFSLIPETPAL